MEIVHGTVVRPLHPAVDTKVPTGPLFFDAGQIFFDAAKSLMQLKLIYDGGTLRVSRMGARLMSALADIEVT